MYKTKQFSELFLILEKTIPQAFSLRQKISMLSAFSTLLPFFIFGQLSIFTPLAFLYLTVFTLINLYFSASNEILEKNPKELYIILTVFNFMTNLLLIAAPAMIYALFIISHIRIFADNKDTFFIRNEILGPLLGEDGEYILTKQSIVLIYHLSSAMLFTRLIAPFVPLSALIVAKDHLPLCMLAKKLSTIGSKRAVQSLKDMLRMEEDANQQRVPTPVDFSRLHGRSRTTSECDPATARA